MGSSVYKHVLDVANSLSREERQLLIEALAQRDSASRKSATSVMDLCGLGQEIWQQIDAQEYVNSERASWNG